MREQTSPIRESIIVVKLTLLSISEEVIICVFSRINLKDEKSISLVLIVQVHEYGPAFHFTA